MDYGIIHRLLLSLGNAGEVAGKSIKLVSMMKIPPAFEAVVIHGENQFRQNQNHINYTINDNISTTPCLHIFP